jgi:hypothetical protein
MYNSHDEIKKLLKASRIMLSSKSSITESEEIKKRYGIITEADDIKSDSDNVFKKINVAKSIEKSTEDTYEEDKQKTKGEDKTTTYRISGGLLKIIGKKSKDLQLTEDEKRTFQETMDEFVEEVSNLVDFDELILSQNDVTWSGKLNDFNMEFDYRVGEENGVYIKIDYLSKLSDEILDAMEKLKNYYNKFKNKWAEIMANRKMTKFKN